MSDPQPNIQEMSNLTGAQSRPAAAQRFLQKAQGPRESPQKMSIITINHKSGLFVLPSGETVPEVAGFPVYYFRTRRYYKKPPKPGEKGQPPDCWSADMLVPHDSALEKQADACSNCKMSRFGTARDGRSQACGTYTWIFLANTAFRPLPVAAIQAPPSSLRTLLGTRFQQGYFGMCEARYGCYEIVWTKFKLKSQGGEDASVQYCTLDPVMGRALDNERDCEIIDRLANLKNFFLAKMDEIRMRATDDSEEAESDPAQG